MNDNGNYLIWEWIPPNSRICVTREVIDVLKTGFGGVVQWARAYASDPPMDDTNVALIRWIIGQYQLAYVNAMLNGSCFIENEYICSLASALLHMIMAYEMIAAEKGVAVVCYDEMIKNQMGSSNRIETLHEALVENTWIMRQLVYYHMGRKRRYDFNDLTEHYVKNIGLLFTMFGNLDWKKAFTMAISQLQDVELRRH